MCACPIEGAASQATPTEPVPALTRAGVHVAPSKSVTVKAAGASWIKAAEAVAGILPRQQKPENPRCQVMAISAPRPTKRKSSTDRKVALGSIAGMNRWPANGGQG